MKTLLLTTLLLSITTIFSQENLLVQSPACYINGVLNGEKATWESENVKIGINKSTADFTSIINFDEFKIQNKLTGEQIKFEDNIMKIYGQIPLNDMLANIKTQQTYKADFTVEFGDNTSQTVFTINITYVSKHYRAVSIYGEVSFSDFNKTPPDNFEEDLSIEMRFQLYKYEGYY